MRSAQVFISCGLGIETGLADLNLHQCNPTCLATHRPNDTIGPQLLWRFSAAAVELIRNLGVTVKSPRWPTGKTNNGLAELGNRKYHREERRGRPQFGFSVSLDVDRRKESDHVPAHRVVLLRRHRCPSPCRRGGERLVQPKMLRSNLHFECNLRAAIKLPDGYPATPLPDREDGHLATMGVAVSTHGPART